MDHSIIICRTSTNRFRHEIVDLFRDGEEGGSLESAIKIKNGTKSHLSICVKCVHSFLIIILTKVQSKVKDVSVLNTTK